MFLLNQILTFPAIKQSWSQILFLNVFVPSNWDNFVQNAVKKTITARLNICFSFQSKSFYSKPVFFSFCHEIWGFFNFSKQARIKRLLMKWVTGHHLLRKLWQSMVWSCCDDVYPRLDFFYYVKKKKFWSSGSVKWRLKSRLWHQPERFACQERVVWKCGFSWQCL